MAITAVPIMGASGVAAAPAIPVQDLGRLSWPHLSVSQQQMVDLVARDLFETELSPEARERIGGSMDAAYDGLPDWRKAPFRGMALKNLGLEIPEELRRAI